MFNVIQIAVVILVSWVISDPDGRLYHMAPAQWLLLTVPFGLLGLMFTRCYFKKQFLNPLLGFLLSIFAFALVAAFLHAGKFGFER